MRRKLSPDEIDAILPQTQCGLCGYGGCMPYAVALTNENAAIDLCTPGGVKTLRQIGALLDKDPEPFVAEMSQKYKPRQVAIIREAECIGCTKCIQACPVDAILGTSKQMHTILPDECTGCELCIPPCPVDCIEMVDADPAAINPTMSEQYRERYHNRNIRLKKEKSKYDIYVKKDESIKRNFILAAIERAKNKRIKE